MLEDPPGLQRHAVSVDGGGTVVWRGIGRGAPLVLLHGGHGSWRHWWRNLGALSAHAQLWLPDMPGYGDSSTPPQPTMDALLHGLTQSLDRLLGAGTPIALAGFSFGGLVAAHLATSRPGVQRLALLGPSGHGGTRRPREALQPWREALRRGDEAALDAVLKHNLCAHMLADPAGADVLAQAIHRDACLRCRFHSRTLSRAAGLGERLEAYGGPVLLLWGEHDVTATPAELIARWLPGHPRRQARVIPGAGHWVAWEAAEAVDTALQAWLAAPGGAPTMAA